MMPIFFYEEKYFIYFCNVFFCDTPHQKMYGSTPAWGLQNYIDNITIHQNKRLSKKFTLIENKRHGKF